MDAVLLLYINTEDGIPLEDEGFTLHIDVDDKLLSAQEELSSLSIRRSG